MCRVIFVFLLCRDEDGKENPLIVDLESKDIKTKRKTAMWFNKVGCDYNLLYTSNPNKETCGCREYLRVG